MYIRCLDKFLYQRGLLRKGLLEQIVDVLHDIEVYDVIYIYDDERYGFVFEFYETGFVYVWGEVSQIHKNRY